MAFKRPRAVSPTASQKRSRPAAGENTQYVRLGTQLPVDEDGDKGSFVPVWKQTAIDERGARRFHGAFTGGFSAGYFNSVGSKDGWTPKTFVSSRSNRKKDTPNAASQRPEDFMDEEDLAEAAESRQLETTQTFAAVGNVGTSNTGQDDFFGLFRTDEDTVGVKIMQKMGWRRDQGIGRKIRRQAQLGESLRAAGADSTASLQFFTPKDVHSMTITHQEQRKGLGFQSEARLAKSGEDEEPDASLALPFLQRAKKPQAPQRLAPKKTSSFGVGVLNDTGSDDEDPYEIGPKIKLNKSIGREKKTKKPSKFVKLADGQKHEFVPRKAAAKPNSALPRTSKDGRVPLKGFVFADEVITLASRVKFPPPKIPPTWKSAKAIVPVGDTPSFQSVTDAAKASTLDAKARASMLGETQLPGKSIFDFITKEGRDRLVALTGNTNLPPALGETFQDAQDQGIKRLWQSVPDLDKDIAVAALAKAKGTSGWMPYADDSKKRERYISFLELRADLKHDLPERMPGMSVPDWNSELQEFAQAAQVFKPASGIMASRFVSAASSTQPTRGYGISGNKSQVPPTKPEDPAEQAAKLGMYGPMTRSQLPFYPTHLLCKRFNVAPPPDLPRASENEAHKTSVEIKEVVSKIDMDNMMHEYLTRVSAQQQRPDWMNQPAEASAPVVEHSNVDVEHNEALSQQRAPDDVFKSIFGDDDDEEE